MVKRSDGRWQEQIKLPGMNKTKYFYGKTQKEVKRKIAEWQKEQECGAKFEAVVEAWDVWHEAQVGYNGHNAYTATARRAKEYFKGREISSIDAAEVDAFIRTIAGKGYAKRTVQQHRDFLHMVFNYAIVNRMASVNPCSAVKLPSNLPKKERDIPTDEQLEKVIAGADLEFGLFPTMLLYTGMRRGEIMALKWSDIDRENRVIHVRRSIYFVGNQPCVKDEAKTSAGIRDIVLLDQLASILPDKKSNTYIFGGAAPYTKSDMRRRWISWCREAGLAEKIERSSGKNKNGTPRIQTDWRPEITPHQLRHAYATFLFEAGVDANDAKDMLGHSSIQVTLDIYTHIRKRQKEKVAEQLNKYMSENNVIDIRTGKVV